MRRNWSRARRQLATLATLLGKLLPVLGLHGYYITTRNFGKSWNSEKDWSSKNSAKHSDLLAEAGNQFNGFSKNLAHNYSHNKGQERSEVLHAIIDQFRATMEYMRLILASTLILNNKEATTNVAKSATSLEVEMKSSMLDAFDPVLDTFEMAWDNSSVNEGAVLCLILHFMKKYTKHSWLTICHSC